MKIIFIFSCSGMFHVPGFIDAPFEPQEGLPVVSDLRQGFLPQKIVQPRV